MATDSYLARLCWNSSNWVRPTGEAARSEQGDTYNAEMGFGHEEWLFNYQWVSQGWKYGFLQPVNKSLAAVQGKTIDVRLYTISSARQWFYVGHLRACEVLTEDMAEAARAEFKRRGWLKDMIAQVRQVGGNIAGLQYERATLLFNVRFRPGAAEIYDPMVPVGASDAIRKLRRYTLVKVQGAQRPVEKQWASRVAATELRPTGKQVREGIAPHEVDLVQNQLQNELFALLVTKHGKAAVAMEEGFVDVKLTRTAGVTLIEIKSDGRPRQAIRQALGQLLEYAFVCEGNGESVAELVVVGPGELGPRDKKYVDHLRTRRGLPFRYVCFRRGAEQVDL
jgi:hypothetical protein